MNTDLPLLATSTPSPLARRTLDKNRRITQRVDWVLIGARGQVGSALRRQVSKQLPTLEAELGISLKLLAAFDRRGFAFDLEGLPPLLFEERLSPRSDSVVDALLERLHQPVNQPTIVIDCTASDEIADLYPSLLANGIGVVAANKRANARSFAFYQQLQQSAQHSGAPYRYETTVGAAIPVLGPLRDLRLRGETVTNIQGVLSGSLSYILDQVHAGVAFSDAIDQARALGYTEPNPLEDLRAEDLARKVLILARECGFAFDGQHVSINPLVDNCDDIDATIDGAFVHENARWAAHVEQAKERNNRLVVLCSIDSQRAHIGLQSVPINSPFAQLGPGQNLLRIQTSLQSKVPVWLGGPGAGPDITAAGVFSDLISAAAQLKNF